MRRLSESLLGSALILVLFTILSSPLGAQQRTAFLTSVTGSGDLSSWPQADGLDGTAAGDRICQKLASAAQLAGTYVAWLSDSLDDAYCRATGRTGRLDDPEPCGEAQVPVDAGPWHRVDGLPFADRIDRLGGFAGNRVYSPLLLDENGLEHAGLAWTGTGSDLAAEDDHCGDWASSDVGAGGVGRTWATPLTWTRIGAVGCASGARLYCLETGTAEPLAPRREPGRRMFATSVQGEGDLAAWPQAQGTGLAAGDAICRNLAADAGLADAASYEAWLSNDSVAAPSRFSTEGPLVRLDGFRIADSTADLLDSSLATTAHQTELGTYLSLRRMWTGTNADGTADQHCGNWQDANAQARTGFSNDSRSGWTGGSVNPCFVGGSIYCIAEDFALFWDGFESGDAAAWSASAP